MLRVNTTLRDLKLDGCTFSDSLIEELERNTRISRLGVSEDTEVAPSLVPILAGNTTLRALHLDFDETWFEWDDESSPLNYPKALISKNTTLVQLWCSHGFGEFFSFTTNETREDIIKAIGKHNSTITDLVFWSKSKPPQAWEKELKCILHRNRRIWEEKITSGMRLYRAGRVIFGGET